MDEDESKQKMFHKAYKLTIDTRPGCVDELLLDRFMWLGKRNLGYNQVNRYRWDNLMVNQIGSI